MEGCQVTGACPASSFYDGNFCCAGRSFDVVVASEVIEHVDSPPAFCRSLTDLTASSGTVILSTLNRTVRAYALAIVAAERVLGILPRDTHDWSKFITPGDHMTHLLFLHAGLYPHTPPPPRGAPRQGQVRPHAVRT